jgi:hypothetical protein
MRIPNPFNRKSPLQRLLATLDDSLDAAGDVTASLPSGIRSHKAKAGLIAAGSLAGLTAASAGISSLRRRLEGPRGDQ